MKNLGTKIMAGVTIITSGYLLCKTIYEKGQKDGFNGGVEAGEILGEIKTLVEVREIFMPNKHDKTINENEESVN